MEDSKTLAADQYAFEQALKRMEALSRDGRQHRILDLKGLSLTKIPPEIGLLTWLMVLDVSNNQLTSLPPEIGQLVELTVLDLSKNQITNLPPEIGQLKSLKHLSLYNNQLTILPPEIGLITELTGLEIQNNSLKILPPEIGSLSALTVLELNNNRLVCLPPEINKLKSLKKLFLEHNKLTTLPPEIVQLSELAHFSVFNNKLKQLPPEIGRLVTWTKLDLSSNELTILPPEIGQLASLKELDLSSNELISLPPEIGQLAALTDLDLSNNRLLSLPPEIGQLASLQVLFLHGNPGLRIPEEVLGPKLRDVKSQTAKPKPPKEILDYYIATRGNDVIALREMKLIVVGRGMAGKTSLVRRLYGESLNPTEPETHGILIRSLTLHCVDGPVKARVWDFGGQHVLHAMHEFFLTDRSLYLLVLEQRSDRSETDAEYWLQLIRSYAPQAPVVVALNKSRGIERPIDRKSLEQKYGPIVAWLPTECLSDEECPGAERTIANLRTALTEAAETKWMSEPRKHFPMKWIPIKNWLETLDREGKNYLDYETFARECVNRGEPDPQQQAELSALMHDLGIAMNYGRDERFLDNTTKSGASHNSIHVMLQKDLLRDDRVASTTVLRPDWLANGIYAILRANVFLPGTLIVPDAILTSSKLGEIFSIASRNPVQILKASDYPPETWDFLLRLMNLFQLSFPLNEDGSSQLCPSLLCAEPPLGTDEPQGNDVVRLRYECPVLPAPLVPRFIVRIFALAEQGKLWQRGAVINYAKAKARVWTTAEEKYLFVTVTGSENDRIDLLDIIRGTLAGIFREYRGLHVIEQRWFDGLWVPHDTLVRFGVIDSKNTSTKEGGESH